MAFREHREYVDLTPSAPLDKKTLNKMAWMSVWLQASFNFERMQAAGWLWGILPGLEKIHTNKEDLSRSMAHNLEFFNTHPFLVTFVMGIVLSLEQQKTDIDTIRSVRVAAMGPLGGIGDALFWFTLLPITAGLTAQMAIDGSPLGPILFLVIWNLAQFAVRFGLMHWSYNLGTGAIEILTKNAKEFTRAASILGVFVVGALTSNYGATRLGIEIKQGTQINNAPVQLVLTEEQLASNEYANVLYVDGNASVATENLNKDVSVQQVSDGTYLVNYISSTETDKMLAIQPILDGVLPQLIPLVLTLMLYYFFTKKNWKPINGIVLMIILGLLGAAIHIWPGQTFGNFMHF